MANGSMWDWNVPALADRYRVLRYDKRGHGGSEVSPGPYSIAQLADDAVGLLDALRIEKAHFMGLSIGGMIGQQLGARYPERMYSLSLCNSASEMPPRSLWEERFEIAKSQGIAGLVDGTIKRWFTAPFNERAPQDIEKVRQMILGTDVNGYMA
jgi:3-oxoadipate enol-lactonase